MQYRKQHKLTNSCLIALGSNLQSSTGTPLETLIFTLRLFNDESLKIRKTSKWYRSPAFPAGAGPDYVNGVVLVETDNDPATILNKLHKIEKSVGRTRDDRWEPRICDLDLLSYNTEIHPDLSTFRKWQDLPMADQKVMTPKLMILPHPRIQDRAFVLVPLRDVAPDWVHPVSGTSVDKMIAALPPDDIDQIQAISP